MHNTSKKIAVSFGYREPLQRDKNEVKLFTDSNKERCKMCGHVYNEGYVDPKNSLFGVGNNSFYSFADTMSDFLCSYCYYNSSFYKKNMQRKSLDEEVFEKITDTSDTTISNGIKLLSKKIKDLLIQADSKEVKLEASQRKKAISVLELCNSTVPDKRSSAQKVLSLITDYNILVSFVQELAGEETANAYRAMNDIADVVVYDEHFEPKDFRSTSTNNDLYNLFKRPPEPPFTVLLKKQKGTTFEFNAHMAKETVDKNYIAVNFGINTYLIDRKKVFECLKDAEAILKKHRKNKTTKQEAFNVSDDVLFNRATSLNYDNYFHIKLRSNMFFMDDYKRFVNKYDQGTRIVAKIMLNTYRNKEK